MTVKVGTIAGVKEHDVLHWTPKRTALERPNFCLLVMAVKLDGHSQRVHAFVPVDNRYRKYGMENRECRIAAREFEVERRPGGGCCCVFY